MFGLGLSEIIFIAILALIFIGPKQLPEVARTVGRFLNDLKRSTSELTDELKASAKIDRIDLYGPAKKPKPPVETANVEDSTTTSTVEAQAVVTTPEPPRAHGPEIKFEVTPESKPEKKDV